MDYDEFLTWAAYVSIYPFPEERADWHAALNMAQRFNMNRGKNTPSRPVADFVPRWGASFEHRPDTNRNRAALEAWYLRFGGDPAVLD